MKSKTVTILLLPIVIYILLNLFHPKISIGILPIENTSYENIKLAKDGLKLYDKYFDVEILDFELDVSNISTQDGFLLNSEMFNHNKVEELKRKYNLDIILMVSDTPTNNWDANSLALWGEADVKTHNAIISTYGLNGPNYVKGVSIHEVIHLLGYSHNHIDKSGIMQYVTDYEHFNLSFIYSLQLPLRVFLFDFNGVSILFAFLLGNFVFLLLIFPYYYYYQKILATYYKLNNKIILHANLGITFTLLLVVGFSIYFYILPFLLIFTTIYMESKKKKNNST